MMSFRGNRLQALAVPTSTAWLLTDIAEAKGRQDLFTRQSPEVLRALRETALLQSVESSNRIEGVTVEPDRLRPLVLGSARPRDRSEEEIHGYREALRRIHTAAEHLPVSPAALRELHRTCQEGAGDAGKWKRIDNDIIEFRPGQPPRVRFRPVRVADAPAAVEELCLSYQHALTQQTAPPLLVVSALVLDFLCNHPFRDGNGRVSRLLTLLALYHHGYEVGRYISLERLIEDSREEYYEALRRSSDDWHDSRHEPLPWVNYLLATIRRAYRLFEERAGQVRSPRGAKTALVEAAISGVTGPFGLTDLERACPGVSRDMIRRVLRNLQKSGSIECLGRGRTAKWRKRGNNA
ncbi:MAG TPA: Fic family protein [Gemmataceae bacterium]|nr:Fic family protein [Gemmataceae bacterium]